MGDYKKLILVVEDDYTSRTEIATMLYKKGMNVISAENGEEATKILKTCQPDCILLDLLMPKMHGHAFLSWLRKTDRDLPVIIMSAVETQPDLFAAVQKLGISGWASKPFRHKKIMNLITQAVEPEKGPQEP